MNNFDSRGLECVKRLTLDIFLTFKNKEIKNIWERLRVILIHCRENPVGAIGLAIPVIVFPLVMISSLLLR